MTITSPYEWRVMSERPGKRILMKVDAATNEVVICEEFLEDAVLAEARLERERPQLVGPDMKPLAVVPASVQSRAINEGWDQDKGAWRRWVNDLDNRSLKTSDGRA